MVSIASVPNQKPVTSARFRSAIAAQDSCNLAACHACGLLPETSCEEFNRFLDRGLVVGTLDDPNLGYFSDTFTG